MKFQPITLFISFVVVMAIGFGIVAVNKETPKERQQGVLMQTASALNSLANDKCAEAVHTKLGVFPYKPNEIDTDRIAFVTLKWSNVGTAKQIECRYVMNEGIILLRIDDVAVIEKDRTGMSGGDTRHKPEQH